MIVTTLYILAALGAAQVVLAAVVFVWYWISTKKIRREHRKQRGWKP